MPPARSLIASAGLSLLTACALSHVEVRPISWTALTPECASPHLRGSDPVPGRRLREPPILESKFIELSILSRASRSRAALHDTILVKSASRPVPVPEDHGRIVETAT